MIISEKNHIRGLLLDFRERQAGSMEKDGKNITWDTATQIVLLLWEDTKGQARKYSVDPACINAISGKLESIHWGCYIEVILSNKKVADVNILSDVMEEIYANEPINL